MFSRLKQFLAGIFLLAFFCLSFSIAFGNDLAVECELNILEQKEKLCEGFSQLNLGFQAK